jgi:predicted lipoprotein with Yx(FWY)xxD motif
VLGLGRSGLVALALVTASAMAACSGGAKTKTAATGTTTTSSSSTTTTAPPLSIGFATDAKLGKILVDGEGKTLYHNIKETSSTLVCVDTACTDQWPPLLAPGAGAVPTTTTSLPGQFGTVARPDGSTQVTYNGFPLYHYANDTKPGDTTGQGVGHVWFVVTVQAAPTSSTTATTLKSTKPVATTAKSAAPSTTVHVVSSTSTANHPSTTAAHSTTTVCLHPPCY